MRTKVKIAVTRTASGQEGYALQVFNLHSQMWQFIGEVFVGPRAFVRASESRQQLLSELEQQQIESAE